MNAARGPRERQQHATHGYLPTLNPEEQQALLQPLERVWAGHFPLLIRGEDDLAFGIGVLLLTLGHPQRAEALFETSQRLYGDHPATMHNLRLCRECLGALARGSQAD